MATHSNYTSLYFRGQLSMFPPQHPPSPFLMLSAVLALQLEMEGTIIPFKPGIQVQGSTNLKFVLVA